MKMKKTVALIAAMTMVMSTISATMLSVSAVDADDTKIVSEDGTKAAKVDYSGAKTVSYDMTAPYEGIVTTLEYKFEDIKLEKGAKKTFTVTPASFSLPDLAAIIQANYGLSNRELYRLEVLYDVMEIKVNGVTIVSSDTSSDAFDRVFADDYSDRSDVLSIASISRYLTDIPVNSIKGDLKSKDDPDYYEPTDVTVEIKVAAKAIGGYGSKNVLSDYTDELAKNMDGKTAALSGAVAPDDKKESNTVTAFEKTMTEAMKSQPTVYQDRALIAKLAEKANFFDTYTVTVPAARDLAEEKENAVALFKKQLKTDFGATADGLTINTSMLEVVPTTVETPEAPDTSALQAAVEKLDATDINVVYDADANTVTYIPKDDIAAFSPTDYYYFETVLGEDTLKSDDLLKVVPDNVYVDWDGSKWVSSSSGTKVNTLKFSGTDSNSTHTITVTTLSNAGIDVLSYLPDDVYVKWSSSKWVAGTSSDTKLNTLKLVPSGDGDDQSNKEIIFTSLLDISTSYKTPAQMVLNVADNTLYDGAVTDIKYDTKTTPNRWTGPVKRSVLSGILDEYVAEVIGADNLNKVNRPWTDGSWENSKWGGKLYTAAAEEYMGVTIKAAEAPTASAKTFKLSAADFFKAQNWKIVKKAKDNETIVDDNSKKKTFTVYVDGDKCYTNFAAALNGVDVDGDGDINPKEGDIEGIKAVEANMATLAATLEAGKKKTTVETAWDVQPVSCQEIDEGVKKLEDLPRPETVYSKEWYSLAGVYDYRNSQYFLAEIVDTIGDARGAIVSFHVVPDSLKRTVGVAPTISSYDAARYLTSGSTGSILLRVNSTSTNSFMNLVTYDTGTSTLSFDWDAITNARFSDNILYVRTLDLLSAMAFDIDGVQVTIPKQEQFDVPEEPATEDDDEKKADDENNEDEGNSSEIEAGENEDNDNVLVEEDDDKNKEDDGEDKTDDIDLGNDDKVDDAVDAVTTTVTTAPPVDVTPNEPVTTVASTSSTPTTGDAGVAIAATGVSLAGIIGAVALKLRKKK